LFHPGLEVIGQAKVDARHRGLVALGGSGRRAARRRPAGRRPAIGQVVDGRIGRWWGHHEFGIAAAQAQLDRARREFGGDLLRRRRQHVLQGESGRRVQRCDQALGQRASVVTTGLGSNHELAVEVLDVQS
jgi:hypothetical protein